MSDLEAYLGRVQATVWSASTYVSAAGLAEAQRLVDHGEPAEGMCVLAWVIVNEDVRVPPDVIGSIRALSEELIPSEELPGTLDDHAMGED